ncbi:MAG: hypothetical protein BGN89_00840 [Alphaproteobacteria bacterium 64-6]|nr:MAG: hypothetical protein BGN89_00840 [Alphaproteobacteria bacterium 64-6]
MPPREIDGSRNFDRLDFQTCWGLHLALRLHNADEDFAIGFEIHDDIIALNSSISPTRVRFYQVKTRSKSKGKWSLKDLTRRPAHSTGPGSSIAGNLMSNLLNFIGETDMLGFVSNASFAPLPESDTEQPFTGLKDKEIADFNAALSAEDTAYQPAHLSLFHFVPAGIPFEDYETHITGSIVECVQRHLGDIDYNPHAFVRALIDECRRKSKPYAKSVAFMDRFQHKFLTRDNVREHLTTLHKRSTHRVRWEDVTKDLGDIPFSDRQSIRDGWRSYETHLLEITNASVNAFRDRLRQLIGAASEKDFHTLMQYVDAVGSGLLPEDIPAIAAPKDYVTGAIIFEIYNQ